MTDQPDNTQKTITLLPQSENDTLCFAFRGRIRVQDHKEFYREVVEVIKKYGSFNLLFHYQSSFNGWEPEAADDNLKAILEYGKNTRRLAYVNPPEKKIMQHKITPDLFGGQMKYFSEEQFDEAVAWVKGG